MTPGLAVLLAYVTRAALALILARRCPALRPVALACVTLAALDVPATWGPPWLRAGAFVAWPGVGLAMAAWGLRDELPKNAATYPSPADAGAVVHVENRAGPIAIPPRRGVADQPHHHVRIGRFRAPFDVGPDDDAKASGSAVPCLARRMVDGFPQIASANLAHALNLTHALALVYLLAGAIATACYGPAHRVYVVALLASRWGAVLALVALVCRHGRPRTAMSLAASIPAIGLACGVVAGAWPLVQDGGLATVARGWPLARAETWAALALQALAMARASRRTRSGRSP